MKYFFYNTDAETLGEKQSLARFPLLIKQGFAATWGDIEYGKKLGDFEIKPDDILLMYQNGVGVVAIGRVQEEKWDDSHQLPILKYYKRGEFKNDDESNLYEYRIKVHWLFDLSDSPITIQQLRERFGHKSNTTTVTRGTIQKIDKRQKEVSDIIEELKEKYNLSFPEEIIQPSLYVEGATRRVSVNAYERNHKAVRQCKAALGTECVICGFNFGAVYGDDFRGFIHVHHLTPLSEIKKEYEVNPITDLRPVCPNCHAIIHYGGRLRSIDEVKQLLLSNTI